MTLKVRILQYLTTFTQLTARLENFLMGWLLVLGLKEGLVECATVCVKSEVILRWKYQWYKSVCMKNRSINCMTCHKSVYAGYTQDKIHRYTYVAREMKSKEVGTHIKHMYAVRIVRYARKFVLNIEIYKVGQHINDEVRIDPVLHFLND